MLWGLGVGGEIQLKITHSLTHSLTHFVRQLIYALNLTNGKSSFSYRMAFCVEHAPYN